MKKKAVLLTIMTLVCCANTSVGADIGEILASTSPYDEGYPPWWHHKGERVCRWGFPLYDEVMQLRTLTREQRADIRSAWQPYLTKHLTLMKQYNELQAKSEVNPQNTSLEGRLQQIRNQIIKNAYDGWLVAKPKFSTQQLEQIKLIARDSAAKYGRKY